MLIRLNDPAAVPVLSEALNERVHYVVERRSATELAVSVLGSYADGGELDVTLFLRAWQAAHPNVEVELLRD